MRITDQVADVVDDSEGGVIQRWDIQYVHSKGVWVTFLAR